MKKIIIALSAIGLLGLFIYWNLDLLSYLYNGDIEKAEAYLSKNLLTTLLLTFLIMLIQHSFTIFPLLLIISINVVLYGLPLGFLWSWFASIIASGIVFYAVRYLFDDVVAKKMPKTILESINENGFIYVFQARIIPFIPTSLVNIAAGFSHVRFFPFITATAAGNFIFFLVLALVSEGIVAASTEQFSLIGIAVVALLIYFGIMWKKKRWKKTKLNA